jgi:hypothetical protein
MSIEPPEPVSEWSLPRISFQGSFLPFWSALCGLGALVVAGVWFAASSGPGPGPAFLVIGLVILGIDLWVFYLRGVRYVALDQTGNFHFQGPFRCIMVQPTEVLSVTHWWMDLPCSRNGFGRRKVVSSCPLGLRDPRT